MDLLVIRGISIVNTDFLFASFFPFDFLFFTGSLFLADFVFGGCFVSIRENVSRGERVCRD